MKRGRLVAFVGAVAIVAAVWASPASAATLVGDYQFQGTRASSGPGNVLLDVGGSNTFQTDSVFGTPRQVLAFPLHSGLKLAAAGVGGSSAAWSVVTTFRLDAITGYRRILDPSPGDGLDRGIYDLDGQADIYPDGDEVESGAVFFEPSHYSTVAVTNAPPASIKVYVGGRLAAQGTGNQTLSLVEDTFRFFKDNDVGGNTTEDSAGAVSCIRVFQGVLNDAEVGAIGSSATCQAPPAPPVKKKCKKHKKKHRSAESAKKKKCKKKKKKKR